MKYNDYDALRIFFGQDIGDYTALNWSEDKGCQRVIREVVAEAVAALSTEPAVQRALLRDEGHATLDIVQRHLDEYVERHAPHRLAALCTHEGIAASVRHRRAAEGGF